MTREEARKAADVMLAYANGEEIEYRQRSQEKWERHVNPAFDWYYHKYRIKPKPKFDPKTLQPFDKVLGLNKVYGCWTCDFYSHKANEDDFDPGFPYMCAGDTYERVIPYNDETKHLVGTSDEAPEYYRYWED